MPYTFIDYNSGPRTVLGIGIVLNRTETFSALIELLSGGEDRQ